MSRQITSNEFGPVEVYADIENWSNIPEKQVSGKT